jgi:D-alanyl-D-alanine dipeptidase
MGTGYDCMDERAHPDNQTINATAYKNRKMLRTLMQQDGFKPYKNEWWHFTLANEPYPNTYFNAPVKEAGKQPVTLKNSRQFILVTTNNWNAVQGTLQRYARTSTRSSWKAVGGTVNVVVGKSGLALGNSILTPYLQDPVKKEGDMRTPSGFFKIGSVFGFAAQRSKEIQMHYIPLRDSTYCVDDTKSKYYNQVADKAKIDKPDWQSGEQMRSIPLYKSGVIVSYNTDEPIRGAGSCIFMHIWRRPDSGTAGCVAMPESDLNQIINWLRPAYHPVIGIFTDF